MYRTWASIETEGLARNNTAAPEFVQLRGIAPHINVVGVRITCEAGIGRETYNQLYFIFLFFSRLGNRLALFGSLTGHENIGAALHPEDELVIYHLLQEYLQLPSQDSVREPGGNANFVFCSCTLDVGGVFC